MKTALITGGLGFIGSELTKKLLKKKIVKKCIILDNFGSFITHTTNLELLQNIVKYTRKSQLDNKKPSIYFCDILITKNKNVESTFYAIKMLDKNTISVL